MTAVLDQQGIWLGFACRDGPAEPLDNGSNDHQSCLAMFSPRGGSDQWDLR